MVNRGPPGSPPGSRPGQGPPGTQQASYSMANRNIQGFLDLATHIFLHKHYLTSIITTFSLNFYFSKHFFENNKIIRWTSRRPARRSASRYNNFIQTFFSFFAKLFEISKKCLENSNFEF